MKTYIYWDVETSPADDFEKFRPEFPAPGNIKDPEKIKAAIVEKEKEWLDKLALSAMTGRILVSGFLHSKIEYVEGEEKQIVKETIERLDTYVDTGCYVVGHNIIGFDLPFLTRRAFKYGISLPSTLKLSKGRYWNDQFIDTMLLWSAGNYQDRISLDNLGKFLGVGQKNGKGGDFASLYATDRKAALEYLANDLSLTQLCAEKLI